MKILLYEPTPFVVAEKLTYEQVQEAVEKANASAAGSVYLFSRSKSKLVTDGVRPWSMIATHRDSFRTNDHATGWWIEIEDFEPRTQSHERAIGT